MVFQSVVGCVEVLFKSAKRASRTRGVLQLLAVVLVSLISQRSLSAQLVLTNGKVVFTPPTTNVGASSGPQTLLLKTTSAVSITSFTIPVSQDSKQEYTVGTVTGCTVDGSTVNPSGTTCTVPITFTPAYPGTRPVPLHIVTSGGNVNIGLAGLGVSPLASITPGVMKTIAGEINPPNCNAYNGPALLGPLCNPSAGAVDSAGNVYVAAFYSNTVSKIDTDGNITVIAGTGAGGVSGANGPALDANIERPADVVIDPAGNVYFADESAQQVFRIDANTQILTSVAGNGTQGYSGDGGQATMAEFNRPEGVAFDLQGNLYVEDQDNNIVRKIDTAGVVTTVAGDPTTAGQGSPTYGGDGGPAIKAGLALCCAGVYASYDSIAVDASGNLFIGDSGHHVVRKVTTDGVIHTIAGNNALGAGFSGDGGVATSAQLNWPMGVATDPAGDVYIADFSNNRIRKIDAATQIITTVAGDGTSGASNDGGLATQVPLNGPQKIVLDGEGNLYVADTKNNLVRKVNVSNPTLVFATPTADGSTDTTDGPLGATISNIGNAALVFSSPATGTNPTISASFSLVTGETGACPTLSSPTATGTLGQGASCALDVTFAPVAVGDITGSLVLTDNSLNASSPEATQTISLAGTATGAPAVTLSPASLTFPGTIPQVTSAAMTSKLTNTGTAALNISGITIIGADPTDFAVTTTCGATLDVNKSCMISVTFTPSAVASYAATLSVTDNAAGSPQTVTLTGSGTGGVTATPTSLNMGSQTEYTENYTPQYITLTNNSGANVTFSNFQSADPQEFYSQAYTCSDGGELLNGSSCELSVRFSPLSVGLISSTITMPYTGGGGGSLVVTVSGTGTAGSPAIDLDPLPIDFGTLQVLTTSSNILVSVEDTGTAPLTGITASITGANASDYTQTNACSQVIVDPNGASGTGACTIAINFTPTGAGPRVATLNISSNSGAATFSTPLFGAGIASPPQIQFAPTQLSLFAGAGTPCADSTSGSATAASLCNITNAATDYIGNTYLVDKTYNVVYKVDTTGALSVFAGTPSKTGGYTGDSGLATQATLSAPTAVAADAFGDIFISDTGNNAIREVDALTGDINTAVTNGCEDDGKGTPHRRKHGLMPHFDEAFVCLSTFQPEGMVFDNSGNLYVADPADNLVLSSTTNGGLGVVAGDQPSNQGAGTAGYNGDGITATTAELNAPQDVAVDSAGNVYIADTLNFRIRKVTVATGIITTVAGSGTQGNTGDGSAATSAEVNAYGVATDLGGDVFIAEGTGGIVRKVDTTGNITTFAGGGTGAISGPAATGGITNAFFARTDNAGDLLIPTGLQVLAAGPDGLLQFGSEPIGSTSAALTATVENTGDSNLSIESTGTTITGADAADFALAGSTCGTSLAPGKTCAISATFKPSASGARTASVSVGSNAAGSPATVLLQGNGSAATAPAASLSPTSISFPNTAVGSTATAMSTTLSNTGNAALTISGITLTGTNTGDFTLTSSSTACGATLAAGSTCTISVTFTPAAAASYTASISVADNATGSPQTAALSGTGTAAPIPVASLSPTTLTFPATIAGSFATAMATTLSNTGNAPLTITGITLTGANTADFAIITSGTACGTSLAAGSTCTISATFTPATAGSFTATISVADNAADSPQTATLDGTGNAPLATDFVLTATPPAKTVAPGAVAQFTVNTTGVNGDFDSAIQLTASGLPSGFTASFAPASVTPGANGASSVLSIQTTSPTALLQPHPLHRGPWLPASLTALLVVPLLGLRKRIRRLGALARALSFVLLLVGALAPVLMLTGCSGGYYSVQTQTYTVTVTGTSGSTQHSTTVTLTVQQ
jgi:sugar lactone lactonase YvrE